MKPCHKLFLLETMCEAAEKGWSTLPLDAQVEINKQVRQILAYSTGTWHANGFYKVTIFEDVIKRISLRVHLWPKGCKVSFKSNIHAHAWDFSSYLVGGTLLQTLYEECDCAPEVFSRFTYRAGSHMGPSFEGEAKVRPIGVLAFKAGDIYHLTAAVLHKIESFPLQGAVTLVLTRNRQPKKDVTVIKYDGHDEWDSQGMLSGLDIVFDSIMEQYGA